MVDNLILVGHLHVLILLHVITVAQKEGRRFNKCVVMAVKRRRERSKRVGTWLQSTGETLVWDRGVEWRGDGGITESSKESGGMAVGRERAQWSSLQYEGPPQGGAFWRTLDYSLVVVLSATRAEVEKSTAPFTTSHHDLKPSVGF